MSLATTARRLTRAEAAAQTRRRLLDAARRVFFRTGFHGATVDAIAEEAGFTKGAVYSRFASKADLFLALYEDRQAERRQIFKRLARTAEHDHATAAAWGRVLREERDWLLLLIEFWTYAARDPAIRERFAALHTATRQAIAQTIADGLRSAGRTVPADPEAVALAHMALGNGFALEALLDPVHATSGAYERAHLALARGQRMAEEPAARRRKEPQR